VRAAALAAMLLALANPVLQSEDRERLPTVVAMVVDGSASQGLADRAEMTAEVREALTGRFAAFDDIDLSYWQISPEFLPYKYLNSQYHLPLLRHNILFCHL
jgi:hypothetical protein